MEHTSDIRRLVEVLLSSSKFHLLVVQGAPGWSKTQTVTSVLRESGIAYKTVGVYATPVGLFNEFASNPEGLLLLDDTAGIFNNAQILSMLCAASWPTGEEGGKRIIQRTSTSERALMDAVNFTGKMIVITNMLPKSPMVGAILNRALYYRAEISAESIGGRLLKAATSVTHFSNPEVSRAVAEFIRDTLPNLDYSKISLRTLEQGYELATIDPVGWRSLLKKILPWKDNLIKDDEQILEDLSSGGGSVEQQVAVFCQRTGKSRRTFFYLRKKASTDIRTSANI